MDLMEILRELRQERVQVEEAILSLTRLVYARGTRRGRPPKNLSGSLDLQSLDGAPRRKRIVSAEARKKMSMAQKRRWAEARKAAIAG